MRRIFVAFVLLVVQLSFLAPTYAQIQDGQLQQQLQQLQQQLQQQTLTGDVGLACQALICLSSATRPSACAASLARYFGISHRKWSDTLRGRLDFLNLCPVVKEDPKMADLSRVIAEGAGRCDASYLNRVLRKSVKRKVCPTRNYGFRSEDDGDNCYYETIWVIGNQLPSYCNAYLGHEYTDESIPTYLGEPLNGGRWQDK